MKSCRYQNLKNLEKKNAPQKKIKKEKSNTPSLENSLFIIPYINIIKMDQRNGIIQREKSKKISKF